MTRPAYRLLDHTGDMAFEVEAPTWPALLAAATAALADIVLAATDEPVDVDRPVEVRGEDREDVLVGWLGEAVLLFEDEGFLAREAEVERADERSARGVLRGRLLDPGREPPDRVIKAVTYHDLRVLPGGAGAPWKATVVLDL